MLTEKQVAKYREHGFLMGSKVLTDEQVGVLQEEVERVIRDRDKPGIPQPVNLSNLNKPETPVWQILNIWQASEPFHGLISHPRIVEQVAQLTGANELRIFHDQIQYKAGGIGGSTRWHQDSPYWQMLARQDLMLTAWVALDDVDEENGCMRMVPGSHRWGDQLRFLHGFKSVDDVPAEFQGHPVEVVYCPVPRGTIHFHHTWTWHCSGANRTARPRRAIALHYLTDQIRYRAEGDHVMKQFVTVADGEILRGEKFPLVWERASS